MFSVSVTEPGKVAIVEIPDPEPGPYDAVIKTELAFLCNATDRKLIEGHFPGVENYPLLLGHESVGIVETVGEKVATFKPKWLASFLRNHWQVSTETTGKFPPKRNQESKLEGNQYLMPVFPWNNIP